MEKFALLFSFIFSVSGLCSSQGRIYLTQRGEAEFKSEALLEVITAVSHSLSGVINPVTKEFAFSVDIISFQGFNSEVQRGHFLEDYLEQAKFPKATFKGKLIENITFDIPGSYLVRAKGMLDIHGIQKERIIRGIISIDPVAIHLTTSFYIPLADHGIDIPKIVRQKIAEQIAVMVDIKFVKDLKS